MLSKCTKMPSRHPQDAAKKPQDATKTRQGRSKTLQDAPKTRPQGARRRPQTPLRQPKKLQDAPKAPPRCPKDARKAPQEHSWLELTSTLVVLLVQDSEAERPCYTIYSGRPGGMREAIRRPSRDGVLDCRSRPAYPFCKPSWTKFLSSKFLGA